MIDNDAKNGETEQGRRRAVEGKSRETDERQLMDVLRAVRSVNQLIAREKDEGALLRRACEILTETRGYRSAWLAVTDASGRMRSADESNIGEPFSALREHLSGGRWPACAQGALADKNVAILRDPKAECGECPIAGSCRGSAALAVALRHGERDYGVLTVTLPLAAADDREERALVAELAGDLAFALHAIDLETQRRAAEAREAHVKQVLLAIRNVNQLIVHEEDPQRLIARACENLAETLGYFNAWIALIDGEGRAVAATASAGFDGQFDTLRERLARGGFPVCMRRALERDAVVVVDDPRAECTDCPLAREYGGRAGFARRLAFEGKTYGILTVSVPAKFAGDREELNLFDEVAGDLGFTLHKIELKARLREADARVRAKLNAVLSPGEDIGEVELADIIDVPAIQGMMDDFHSLTGMCMAVLDLRGKILVAAGWQDICTKFHRVHPEMQRHCVESDTVLSSGVEPGSFKIYRCKNNLWDIATPIMLGGRHAGNLFLGQFLFEGEEPDREIFRAQAGQYGFDEAAYLAALDRLPRWNRERVTRAMTFFTAFARQISDLSYANIKIARSLAQRDELLGRLARNEERQRLALKATNDVVWDWDVLRDSQRWNESGAAVFGWTDIVAEPQTADWWIDRIHPEDCQRVDETFFAALRDPGADRWSDEYRFRKADGAYAHVVDRGYILRDADGRAVRMIGAMLDITGRKRAEDALRRSRRLLTATEALSAVGGWEWDVTTQTMAWTDGTYRIHDLDPVAVPPGSPEHIARSLSCYDPEDRLRVEASFRRCVEKGEAYDLECGFTTAAGRRLRVRTMGLAVREDGRIVKVQGNLQDVTERKEAEQSLRESEARFATIFRSSPMAAAITTIKDGRLVDVNAEFERITGRARDDCIGRTVPSLGLWADPEERAEMVRKTREEGAVHGFESRLRHVSGEILPVLLSAEFVRIGEAEFLLTMALDISRRKQAEEALWQSREILRAVLDSIPVRVFWKDTDLNYLGCNLAFARDAGFDDPKHMVGKDDFAMGWREQAELYRSVDRMVVEDGKPRMLFEEPQTAPSGEKIHLLTSKVPLRDAEGAVIGVLGTYMDITERKRAEKEREKLQAQLLQAQKMESVGRLAGGVAHDFNNMLSIILGYGEMLLDQLHPDDPLSEDAREIMEAANRSSDLTRQLLAFARKQTLQPEVLLLNDIVLNFDKMLRRIIGEDIELQLVLAEDIEHVLVDRGQIEQVITNLAVNARDAMPSGGKLIIETGAVELDETYADVHPDAIHGRYATLAMTDTGCGMDQEVLSQIFEPFFTTKEMGRGTGLGLSTVYGIVKQSNGNIRVYSELGQGTTFKIYLPETGLKPAMATDGRKERTAEGAGQRILVVEDEPSLRKLLEASLSRLGYKVTLAANGGEALLLMEEKGFKPDLIVTDMVMPNMNGRELVNRLRRNRPDLKALYMSGYADNVLVHHGGLDPQTPFIQKPFTIRDIAGKVRAVLQGKRCDDG